MKYVISFAFLLGVIIFTAPKTEAEYIAPIVVKKLSISQLITLNAIKYGVAESTLHRVIKCESSYNEKAWNKLDPGVGSKGIAQFQEPTFYGYAKVLGITTPDIWNSQQQIQVMAYLFSEGKSYLWTCARKYDNLDIE